MIGKKPAAAGILALLLAACLLGSVLFLVLEAGHDCDGEDCRICAQMAACEEILRVLSAVSALFAAASAVPGVSARRPRGGACPEGGDTPVSRGERLLN